MILWYSSVYLLKLRVSIPRTSWNRNEISIALRLSDASKRKSDCPIIGRLLYASPEPGTWCHVYILDNYISKVPQDAVVKDNFYLQPLSTIPKCPNKSWFSCTPVPHNTLAKAVGEMCTEANISGHKMNHSLRATGCSRLFQAGVPENH